jgi:hypothetical protein
VAESEQAGPGARSWIAQLGLDDFGAGDVVVDATLLGAEDEEYIDQSVEGRKG